MDVSERFAWKLLGFDKSELLKAIKQGAANAIDPFPGLGLAIRHLFTDEDPEENDQSGNRNEARPIAIQSESQPNGQPKLTPCVRLAWASFLLAINQADCESNYDRELFDWLQNSDWETLDNLPSELRGYQLPSFDTWGKYVRTARKVMCQNKYNKRTGRTTGKSIVRDDQI